MKLSLCCLAVWVVALGTFQSRAADNPSGAASATGAPLKVLYITGGGFHKYDKLTPIIVDGIKKHANAEIDVKFGLDGMRDKNLGQGYDAIIYNICFAGDEKANTLPKEADQELVDNALRVTREGKPT